MTRKILAYCHAYVGHGREAGAETTLANLLESLVRAGWEATVLLSDNVRDGQPYVVNGVTVLPDARGRKTFPRIVQDFDVVVSHLECSEQAAVVCQRSGVPIVHLVHNTFWQTEGYLAMGCSLAVYNSEWVANHHSGSQYRQIVSQVAKREKHAEINFTARVASSWPYVVLHPQIEPELYYTDGPHDCVGFVNFHENKNPAVFYEMARRFPEQQFLGLLGGYGHQDIQELPNVEFIENTPDITGEFYSRCRVLLVPSHYESFGRVAVEAQASGVAVVASATPGLKEALRESALYADPDNMTQWETALEIVLNNKALYSRLSIGNSRYWAEQAVIETMDLIPVMDQICERYAEMR
jgi:glycosyltransferase involved in cell wall biosynthesis